MGPAPSPPARGAAFAGPLNLENTAAVRQLRKVLEHHGYMGSAAIDARGSALPFATSHQRDDMPLYLRCVAAPTPINTLIKLFVLDRSVDAARAAAAFAPLDLDDLRDLGLIADGPRGIRATLRLSVHDGLILAHDADDEETRTPRPDHVPAVNPATISLSNLTVRRSVPRALEIGTGCGVLALRAARHSAHVVGTDTNARALNIAAFNAAINNITNVEWRLGSLFEAVAGETFDLIFCNPPHVLSPDSPFIFRDGGPRGDALCEEIIRRAPAFLKTGGFATVVINWAVRHGEAWADPLRRWIERNGCDNWLMMSALQDPTSYAATWTRTRDREKYAADLDRWIHYFEELNLMAIGLGAVVIRKTGGRGGWTRADHLPETITDFAGAHVERLFEAEDRLARLTDDQLLAQSPRTVRDHVLRQSMIAKDGDGYTIESAEVRLQGGLPFRGSVDASAIELLAKCDGVRPLASIAADIAGANNLDPDTLMVACAGIARRLIASGFLVF